MEMAQRRKHFWSAIANCLNIWPVEVDHIVPLGADAEAIRKDWLAVRTDLRNTCSVWSAETPDHDWPVQMSLFGSENERSRTAHRTAQFQTARADS